MTCIVYQLKNFFRTNAEGKTIKYTADQEIVIICLQWNLTLPHPTV